MEDSKAVDRPSISLGLDQTIVPLCKATETLLTPPRLREGDTLFIWNDPHTGKFFLDLRYIEEHGGVKQHRTYPGVSSAAQESITRIPEHRFTDFRDYNLRFRCVAAKTDFTALIIHHLWPKEQIQFRPPGLEADGEWTFPEDEEAKVEYQFLLTRFFAQTIRATRVAEYKKDKSLPPDPDFWVDREDRKLADYQKMAAHCILKFGSGAIFADRGTGKTPIGVQIISHLARVKRREGKGMLRALVICPPQVRYNWTKEFERFATVPGKVVTIKGPQLKRLKLFLELVRSDEDCAFSVGVVGYDTTPPMLETFIKLQWDIIICDESHKFKSDRTNRWKTLRKLREFSKINVPMSGSPIGNSPFDIWTQLEMCYKGASGFESLKAFRRFYGQWRDVRGQPGVQALERMKNMPLFQERLARLSFQMTKEEAGLELPDKVYDYYEVEMTKEQAQAYAEVSTKIELEIAGMDGEMSPIKIENILTKLLRLAQVTSGHIGQSAVVDEETGKILAPRKTIRLGSVNPKIEAVIDMLKDPDRDPNGKTIVWCCFVEDIEWLKERIEEEGIPCLTYYGGITHQDERDKVEELFNHSPDHRVIVCNAKCAGEGLNLVGYDWDKDKPELPTYTDHEVFMSCTWSALERGQAEDRAHRRGSRTNVRITDLIVPGTIDEEIRERVVAKQKMAQEVLDIRSILDAVFKASR